MPMKVTLITHTPDPEQTIACGHTPRLLEYIRDARWSALDQASMTVEVTTSRHRAMKLMQRSDFNFLDLGTTSVEVDVPTINNLDQVDKDWWDQASAFIELEAKASYYEALRRGIDPDTAAMLLPMASITRIRMSGTCRCWLRYIMTGGEPEFAEIFAQVFPTIRSAL